MFEPIAIVGRSCILPGASSPAALWEAVAAGRDLIAPAPAGRWGLPPHLALTDDPARSQDRAWSDRGGYVTDDVVVDEERWRGLDPLFHWVLHTGREALREAGHEGPSDRVAAIFGNLSFPSSAMSRYAEHVWLGREAVDPRNRFMSGLPALLLAQELGLGAGAFALDAACASSLYAIKLACDRLHDREIDLAVAGAVCRSDDLFIHVGFCALDAMSRTGRSRPFHRGADGLVPAEGAAMLALKRLSDAVAAGDTIHGVIRGAGLSNDGRGRGLLAPDSGGQARALRRAWEVSGVDPRRLSLVECHATGTPVGDATEVNTLQAVFPHADGVPLGSLKSNLGHLITAAGAAAVLKVLGAFQAGIRPPTLHVDDPNPALAGTGFRLLAEAEPWDSDGPRTAGVSAFGFGGNNAHLVLEEWVPSAAPSAAATPRPSGELAVVGIGVRAPGVACAADLVDALVDGRRRTTPGAPARGVADAVVLPLEDLKFPPRDLEQTLAQQLMLLQASLEATAGRDLPRDRTAVLIGSQSDPEVCRYGARWRLAGWSDDADWVARAKDAVVPVLKSAGVVGNMPNIPANRIGSQLDLGGPGFTLAAEEHSGLAALRTGARMLRAGEVDLALVGAVDLSAEAVHEAAANAVVGPITGGDAAVVLVLERLDDARRAGRRVLAVLPESGSPDVVLGDGGVDLGERFGRAHAALPLLHVAAAVLGCATGLRPTDGPAEAWPGSRAAEVVARSMTGTLERVLVASAGEPQTTPARPAAPKRPVTFPSHPPAVVLPPRAGASAMESMSPAPRLPSALVDAAVTQPGSTGFEAEPSNTMAAPPGASVQTPTPRPIPAPSPMPTPTSTPLPIPTPAVPPVAAPHLAELAALTRQLSSAHAQYLQRQQQVHANFLAMRQRTTAQLLNAVQSRGTPLPMPAPAPAPLPKPATAPKPPQTPAPAPRPAAPPLVPPPALSAAPAPAPKRSALPGPKWDRAQLEVLASDKISKVFGPLFARQDDFPRQVRMPEPPLLLADRVTGLDAEPGSMTTGTIWTETDIHEDSWYLHDGVMPAGVMIEAGQADLLLISWLGADFQNKGERVYRLLGCQLTYNGGLPRPGETLHYEICVDGHANLGATRIFFFHYDCVDDAGNPRLTVREGQAGFFSDAELAESGGILWTPETGEHDAAARLDPPKRLSQKTAFTEDEVLAFANGDGFRCFGEGFERLQTHVRSPRIAPPPMSFWQRVTELDPKGGPWGRGYLKAEQDITPEDWFFQGHFKDDPCMPGTMMFEACLQAVAFYMAALGFTIDKDGWTFEPVPDLAYDLRCRGQVIPSSRYLSYEVFVEEVHDGPWPVVYADFLCTVDGLKAFWARRVGVRLRPDWPITSRPEILDGYVEPKPVAVVDGFEFGFASLMACAWGKPSEAFGPMYTPFDEGRHCARLPGPPYHFMSRLTRIDGPIGGMQIGTEIALEYDIPADEWYFDENGNRTMPYCVLLEAALQPCGWIACYVGSALTTDKDLYFRNLDGTATWTAECFPESGTLTTKAKITGISQSGGMIIESFVVQCYLGDTQIYDMKTVFGFFPREALANQIGITPTDAEREKLHEPCDFLVDLTKRPAKYCGGTLRLPQPMLLMLDRVTGFWPDGGKAGLGRLRSEKDVDPSEWFFKAHFYTDPVQPGSLGIEAMIQLLQFFMLETEMHAGMKAPRFEPIMMGRELSWKYRGQVIPENDTIRCEIEITEVGEDDRGRYAICDAYLWVDKLRIYSATGMGMRIVDDPDRVSEPVDEEEELLTPAGWVGDHRPTWTIPSLPAMSMVDRLAAAAKRRVAGEVVEVRDVKVHGWVKVEGPTRLKTEVKSVHEGEVRVALLAWRERPDPRLSRFEPAAEGTVHIAPAFPEPPAALTPLAGSVAAPDPYETGALFHGPAFRYLTSVRHGEHGSTALLDVARGTVPPGTLGQGLLDAVLHAIPHDDLHRWSGAIPADVAAYPLEVRSLRLYGPAPTSGQVRVEARLVDERPTIALQAIAGDRVWLELDLVEVLLPKGPIGSVPGPDRVAFLRDRAAVPGVGLSAHTGGATTVDAATIRGSDWLPGTVAAVYGSTDVADVAVQDHVARRAEVHPGTVARGRDSAVSSAQPLTRWPVSIEVSGTRATARDAGEPALDLSPITDFWDRWFGVGRWPVEDVYYGLLRRFVRRVHVVDPERHAAIRGRSLVYLGNHQVGIESLLFSILAGALNRVTTVTIAKAEHRETWLGQLIAHCFSYPGVRDPEVITFFDREDKESLPRIVAALASEMHRPGKSLMVHVEGTRAVTCRRPVEKMSGAFVDMAVQVGAPIVPVRFVGGLPVAPSTKRLEYPHQLGRQDFWLGRPILPKDLAAMPYKDRKQAIVDAINATGPANATEEPFPGDPALEASALAWAEQTGALPAMAVILKVLEQLPDPTPEIARVVQGARTGQLSVGDDPKERWLSELARRLYGPKGPKVG